MRRAPNAFWRFSLATYRLDGVASTCLDLQDQWAADVNLLLYCCWLGGEGRRINMRSLRNTMAMVAHWQSVVIKPLRLTRRALKNPPEGLPLEWTSALGKRVGAIELDLEYLEQHLLHAAAQGLPPMRRAQAPEIAIAANLVRYLSLLGVPAPETSAPVANLVKACCAAADQKR